jgi:hypothetical protein
MGSFTDGSLRFDFAPSTPDHVLAAFSALAVPSAAADPALPPPVVEAWPAWEPDWREAGWAEGQGDPFEHEPWRHDWASVVGGTDPTAMTPYGRLLPTWRGGWHLDCRFGWKCLPETVSEALSWVAPYVDTTPFEWPVLVGWAQHEYAPRPQLFWVHNGEWIVEDLIPEGVHWG